MIPYPDKNAHIDNKTKCDIRVHFYNEDDEMPDKRTFYNCIGYSVCRYGGMIKITVEKANHSKRSIKIYKGDFRNIEIRIKDRWVKPNQF